MRAATMARLAGADQAAQGGGNLDYWEKSLNALQPPTNFPASFPAPQHFPNAARLLAPAQACAYLHFGHRVVAGKVTALEAWNAAMARPLPGIALAFRIRDAISARFGVAPIGGFSGARRDQVAAGDRLDFFLIEEVTPERLMLSARDRHLDVMTCITATPTQGGPTATEVAITSSVVTHNLFGRAYMLPVGPAHRLIVWATLRRISQHFGD